MVTAAPPTAPASTSPLQPGTWARAWVTFSLVVSGTIEAVRSDAAAYRRTLSTLLDVPVGNIELSLSSASVRIEVRITPRNGTRAEAYALVARATVGAVLDAAEQAGMVVETVVTPSVIVEIAVASTGASALDDDVTLASTLAPSLVLVLLGLGGCRCLLVWRRRQKRVARVDAARLHDIACTRAYCHAHPGLTDIASSSTGRRIQLKRKARVHVAGVEAELRPNFRAIAIQNCTTRRVVHPLLVLKTVAIPELHQRAR